MAQLRTILGFFDDVAEAQQAVQWLLAKGFTQETIELSTHPPITSNVPNVPATTDSSSGRFSDALFGNQEATSSAERPQLTGRISLRVQTRLSSQVRHVTDLLRRAGADDVAYPDD